MVTFQAGAGRSVARRRAFVATGTDPMRVSVPEDAFTLGGFRAWALSDELPERARVAFVTGDVYLDTSNEDPETHVAVKAAIAEALSALNRALKLGKFYGDGVLVTHGRSGLSCNPDATFLSRASLLSGRARLVPRPGRPGRYSDIEGSPDMVLEVVSDSSVEKDTVHLRSAYHAAGVPEYWLVDARGERVVFRILRREKRGYGAAAARGGWQRSQVFGRSFRLERERDEFGLWDYTLRVRAK